MGLYKGQNIITGFYMLPRADDNRQVNVSRKRRHKKKERGKKKSKRGMKEGRKIKKQRVRRIFVKKAQVYPVFDSRACDIQRKGIHCINEGSRQLTCKEVQKIYIYLFS
jgi:hypothetical protein